MNRLALSRAGSRNSAPTPRLMVYVMAPRHPVHSPIRGSSVNRAQPLGRRHPIFQAKATSTTDARHALRLVVKAADRGHAAILIAGAPWIIIVSLAQPRGGEQRHQRCQKENHQCLHSGFLLYLFCACFAVRKVMACGAASGSMTVSVPIAGVKQLTSCPLDQCHGSKYFWDMGGRHLERRKVLIL
jgi:hypothetical protein